MNSSTIALIPARGGSKGVPRKNVRLLAGIPLVAHTIQHSISASRIDRTIVNSEDEEIRNVAKSFGAETMDRPEEFYHDNTFQEVDRLLMWCVRELEKKDLRINIVVLLYATSPLRRVAAIDEAVAMVSEGGFDSVLSLCEDSKYIWKVDGACASPVNYDPATRGPRQKETWNQWIENKALYVMRRDLLMDTGCRLGGRIGYVEMTSKESIDIDSVTDFQVCEAIISSQVTPKPA